MIPPTHNTESGHCYHACLAAKPCPVHDPALYAAKHGNGRELFAVSPDTIRLATGPLEIDVESMVKRGTSIEVIAALWNDLAAVYRRWEMRDMPGPKYGMYHHADHWFINGSDRDQGHRGFFTDDVALAMRFDTPSEGPDYLRELGLIKPEHGDHTRWGYTVLRIR